MNKNSAFFVLLLILFSCNSNSQIKVLKEYNFKSLSENERVICDNLEFDKDLVLIVKNYVLDSMQSTPETDSVYNNFLKKGLCTRSYSETDYEFVLAHKEQFRKKGYLLFIFGNEKNLSNYIAILKGNNELDLIKWSRTNAINYGINNKKLYNKFAKWKVENDFWILGVGLDFIFIKFKGKIKNVSAFANEVAEFCPDAISQGAGDLLSLNSLIKQMNGMYFWWD